MDDSAKVIADFLEFCQVNQRLAPRVSKFYRNVARRFLRFSGGPVSEQAVRKYLGGYLSKAPKTYNNQLDGLRAFITRYLDAPGIMARFKKALVPQSRDIELPTKCQLRRGFEALDDDRERAIYLFTATTGMRSGEVWNVKLGEIDFKLRAVRSKHWTRTKKAGITFYNEECEHWLKAYLESRNDGRDRLFVIGWRPYIQIWKKASRAAGFRIRPQVLRYWFSTEMGELKVPDRFVDVFQGRAPKTVLAKFYTARGLERLKRIYDSANLRVLS